VNVFKNWVPDGSPVTKVRDVGPTATATSAIIRWDCTGGSRREMLLCVMCHYTGVIDPDTGNTVDMKGDDPQDPPWKALPSVIAGSHTRSSKPAVGERLFDGRLS